MMHCFFKSYGKSKIQSIFQQHFCQSVYCWSVSLNASNHSWQQVGQCRGRSVLHIASVRLESVSAVLWMTFTESGGLRWSKKMQVWQSQELVRGHLMQRWKSVTPEWHGREGDHQHHQVQQTQNSLPDLKQILLFLSCTVKLASLFCIVVYSKTEWWKRVSW